VLQATTKERKMTKMRNLARSVIITAATGFAVFASQAMAKIPEIDSSGWSTDPTKFGMTAGEYINAESNAFMADFIGRSGINKFYHFPGLSTAEDTWVVSPNNDTIYSLAIVNTRGGFTLKLPEVGDRFLSTQIITQDHMTPYYIYGGGTHTFKAGDFETDYVAVGVRMGTNGTKEDIEYVTKKLQPQYAIEGASDVDDLPRPDLEKMKKVREALLKEYSKLDDTFSTMKKHVDEVNDWERFTYVTAGAWGLSEDENAMYKPYALPGVKGGDCYTATYPPVPAKAFFSITVYGPKKYLMSDENNIVSSNRDIKLNDDGSFTVAFGGKECRDLAPNFAYTPEDGWSLLMRAYRPDVEAFKAYRMPALEKKR
jgi:hypothetical protein